MIIFTNKYRNYIESCAQVLGLDQYKGELDFTFKKKLDQDAAGYTWDMDDGNVYIEIASHVQGEPLPIVEILQNIAHEMIHAEQFASGRMKDLGLRIASTEEGESLVHAVEWEGEIITNLKYEDQPWEIEAYGFEQFLRETVSFTLPFKDYERYYG